MSGNDSLNVSAPAIGKTTLVGLLVSIVAAMAPKVDAQLVAQVGTAIYGIVQGVGVILTAYGAWRDSKRAQKAGQLEGIKIQAVSTGTHPVAREGDK